MSRIGKKPVPVPSAVKVDIAGNRVSVKGPAGELSLDVHPSMSVALEGGAIQVSRPDDKRLSRAAVGDCAQHEAVHLKNIDRPWH